MVVVPVTEASLRAAMRDPRYWQSGHPERQAYADWVGEGFRALHASSRNGDGVIHVRAHTRLRAGKPERVDAHVRTASARALGDVAQFSQQASGGDTPLESTSLLQFISDQRGSRGKRGDSATPPAISPLDPLGRRRSDQNRPEALRPSIWGGMGRPAQSATSGSRGTGPESVASRRIHSDSQGKHIAGHRNFMPGRSTLTVDAQELLDRFAGSGQALGPNQVGTTGSRERFDTGDRVIGTYRNGESGQSAPTTVGIIHYRRDGAHIVPARPRDWIEPTDGSHE